MKIRSLRERLHSLTVAAVLIVVVIPQASFGSGNVNLTGDPAFATFMSSYAQAINTRDSSALERLVHPDCLSVRNENVAAFNFWLKNEQKRTVPSTYQTRITKLPADYPIGNCPVRPTHKLQWDFVIEQPRTDWTITRHLIRDNGQWYLVLP